MDLRIAMILHVRSRKYIHKIMLKFESSNREAGHIKGILVMVIPRGLTLRWTWRQGVSHKSMSCNFRDDFSERPDCPCRSDRWDVFDGSIVFCVLNISRLVL